MINNYDQAIVSFLLLFNLIFIFRTDGEAAAEGEAGAQSEREGEARAGERYILIAYFINEEKIYFHLISRL